MSELSFDKIEEKRLQELFPEWTIGVVHRAERLGAANSPRIYTFEAHRKGPTADFRSGTGQTVASAATNLLRDMEQNRRQY